MDLVVDKPVEPRSYPRINRGSFLGELTHKRGFCYAYSQVLIRIFRGTAYMGININNTYS